MIKFRLDKLFEDVKKNGNIKSKNSFLQEIENKTGRKIHRTVFNNLYEGRPISLLEIIGDICQSFEVDPKDYIELEKSENKEVISLPKEKVWEKVREIILEYLKTNKNVSMREIQSHIRTFDLPVGDNRVWSEVKSMTEKGLINKVGDRKSSLYFVKEDTDEKK